MVGNEGKGCLGLGGEGEGVDVFLSCFPWRRRLGVVMSLFSFLARIPTSSEPSLGSPHFYGVGGQLILGFVSMGWICTCTIIGTWIQEGAVGIRFVVFRMNNTGFQSQLARRTWTDSKWVCGEVLPHSFSFVHPRTRMMGWKPVF